MEKYTLTEDLKVFGIQVDKFPTGIGEAFDKLVKMIPEGFKRSYYGIAEMMNKGMIYRATAEEKQEGEAEKYGCENYTIEKGEYLTVTLRDWQSKTNTINSIFHNMIQDDKVDRTKPSIEWYKNEHEMLCMLKLKA